MMKVNNNNATLLAFLMFCSNSISLVLSLTISGKILAELILTYFNLAASSSCSKLPIPI